MPNKQFDLHLHSNFSDGQDSPETVLKQVKKAKIKLAAITDHNTLEHLPSAGRAGDKLKINVLSGIEFGTEFEGRELHILGYCFDPENPGLKKALAGFQKKRRGDLIKIAVKLEGLGFEIDKKTLSSEKADYLGLFHAVKQLKKNPKNLSKILKEIGDKNIFSIINAYMAPGRPAYVPERLLPAKIAISLIRKAGGFAVLAHPGFHLSSKDSGLISKLKSAGLTGLEVFTPKHNWEQIKRYEFLAKRLNLIITAGSDYHQEIHDKKIPLIDPVGFLKIPTQVYDDLIKFLKAKNYHPLKY